MGHFHKLFQDVLLYGPYLFRDLILLNQSNFTML